MNTYTEIKTGNISVVKERIEKNEIHKNYIFNGLSALHIAVRYGQKEIVRLLIEAGAELDSQTTKIVENNHFDINKESTPLHLAVQFNQIDIFGLLVTAGAKLNICDDSGKTPFILAVDHKIPKLIKYFIKQKVWDPKNKTEVEKILLLILKNGDEEFAKAFIEKNSWDPKNKVEAEKILLSILENNYSDLAKTFIKKNSWDPKNKVEAEKILLVILEKGNGDLAKLFIEKSSIEPDMLLEDERPLLCEAVKKKNIEVCKALLEIGANPNGLYDESIENKLRGKKEYEIAKIVRDKNPIILATKNNYVDIVKLLIDFDADLMMNIYSWGPTESLLSNAVINQKIELVKLFLKNGLDFNDDFHQKENIFDKAVKTKNQNLILEMLKYGVEESILEKHLSLKGGYSRTGLIVKKLYNTSLDMVYQDNTEILKKFLVDYLHGDKTNYIGKLPIDTINIIIELSNDKKTKLPRLTFENYIKHHPINISENIKIDVDKEVEVLGDEAI